MRVTKRSTPPLRLPLNRCSVSFKPSGMPVLDVTARSAVGELRRLAPTWDMVTDSKAGKLGHITFTRLYSQILDEADLPHMARTIHRWARRFHVPTITFMCYCRDEDFCHTHLLINRLMADFPELFWDARSPVDFRF